MSESASIPDSSDLKAIGGRQLLFFFFCLVRHGLGGMAGSWRVSLTFGKTSSSAEILSSDSKELASSMGKVFEVCEVSTSQKAESTASPNFTTRESRSGRVLHGPSVPEPS